ncbi:MAG: ATP-binding cassette domain-containing protein [Simkaniaceae bacterium]|jgi:phospholipid/cholesterol/gamma-HCH transport system ATP-binding protein|nr:MAG: ATP-binding cassette domain-containing protein [Simkaniaceae bacterium]
MIEIEDLWKAYEGNQVLKGLTLKVETGETLVILGRSGVGKSVLLKHIIGIAHSDRGHIEVDGVRVSDLKGEKRYSATRHMGMLFQGAALFDSMNIEENTAFYLKQHGDFEGGKKYSKSEIQDRVDEALRMVDLEGTQKKMPSDLSGGMRKRAGLARLIVYRPKYLLYDEPTTGLDPITAMQINELIVKTQEELKATSIVVTHDIISSLYVGDRLALHKDGKIAYIETPDAFLKIDDPIIEFLRKTISEDPRTFRRK